MGTFFKEVIFILYTLCKDCNTKIEYGNIRCNNCIEKREEYLQSKNKQYNRDRYIRDKQDNSYRLFYSSNDWLKKREEILKINNYECAICKELCRYELATDVHHILNLKDNYDKRLDNDNLISLCHNCHYNIVHKLNLNNKDKLQKHIKKLIKEDKFIKELLKNNIKK